MPTMINDPDSLTWGRLVKSWATDLDYVNTPAANQPPQPPAPLPTAWRLPPMAPVSFQADGVQRTIPFATYLTTTQFSALCAAAGINSVNYPPATTDVIMVQGDATTMVIRLPPKTVLQASEQSLLTGGSYPTPSFYDLLYAQPGGPVPSANPPRRPNVAGIMDLHANRIGDYTMGLCA
jgi:hypothetical protein